jgi:hypothetical protein
VERMEVHPLAVEHFVVQDHGNAALRVVYQPNGVTDPGVSASTSRSKSGRPNENRGASNTFSSRRRSARLSAGMTTNQIRALRFL